jgi:hypothetical protein
MTAALTVSQKETLDQFVSGAYRLEKLVCFLTEEQLDKSIAPGEWSIRQIVHHLSTDGDGWSFILQKAIATPGVRVSFGEPGDFPGNETIARSLAWDKRPIAGALALIKAHRHVMAELAICFPDKWENYVTFNTPGQKEPGKMTFGQIIQMLTDHLAEHIATIEAIKKIHGM